MKNKAMRQNSDFHIPTYEEFRKGYELYDKRETRGFVYFEALALVTEGWGSPELMAMGVQRLIRSWNHFFANFNFNDLIYCLDRNIKKLDEYRNKHIFDLSVEDNDNIRSLFNELLIALKRESDGVFSPVSVAKSIGILAPHFLPIWDSNIAFKYDCFYLSDMADSPYIRFCYKMKIMAENVHHFVPSPDDRSLLKRIDEYNYSKYTMHWI